MITVTGVITVIIVTSVMFAHVLFSPWEGLGNCYRCDSCDKCDDCGNGDIHIRWAKMGLTLLPC